MPSSYGSRELFAPRAGLVLVCRVLNFVATVLRSDVSRGHKFSRATDALQMQGLQGL